MFFLKAVFNLYGGLFDGDKPIGTAILVTEKEAFTASNLEGHFSKKIEIIFGLTLREKLKYTVQTFKKTLIDEIAVLIVSIPR